MRWPANHGDALLVQGGGFTRGDGTAGNDTLDGGLGADTLLGGAGDDTYVVNAVGDRVVENALEGIDRVLAGASFTLGANVENLTLTGSGAFNGTGNALDNACRPWSRRWRPSRRRRWAARACRTPSARRCCR